ncbi:MAG: ABC transporter substrate-binding protein [Anaerolineae bacterium]|nr:ABC transporter substrate-binding protein [Anaerolineae bacterium]
MNRWQLDLREFLALCVCMAAEIVLVIGLFGCAPVQSQATAEPTVEVELTAAPTTALPQDPEMVYREAPMLAERVAHGTLPPVEERLPGNPKLIEPVERVGVYGGVWRRGVVGEFDNSHFRKLIYYEYLVSWDPQWTRIVPNVTQSFAVNEDSTEYIFHLREGMRWSDGAPFTADDIVFWYEDIVMNTDIWEEPPVDWLVAGGAPGQVIKIDDYTVAVRFATPYGLFLENMIYPTQMGMTYFPKHYVQQFLPKYNPGGLDHIRPLLDLWGLDHWSELFTEEIVRPQRLPDMPTLDAWILQDMYDEGNPDMVGKVIVAQRNPYYWKIDTEFNQLPYIDEIRFTVVPDQDGLIDMVLRGEIDMQNRNLSSPVNRPQFEAIAEAQDYVFFTTIPSTANRMLIHLNMLHPDPVKRQIFSDRRFRMALSHAIDRQEVIKQVWAGQGEPRQAAPLPSPVFHHERLATQYLEYDVELANQILDEAGYGERDAEGLRLGPDGKSIRFTVDIVDEYGHKEAMDLIQGYWHAVGIDVTYRVNERGDLRARAEANEHDAVVWTSTDGMFIPLNPAEYVPIDTSLQAFAVPWAVWAKDPDSPLAEEPPEEIKRQLALYEQASATRDQNERLALYEQIMDIAADRFNTIGISTWGAGFGIRKTYFHNVPPVMPEAWVYPQPAPTHPCQYFFDPQR